MNKRRCYKKCKKHGDDRVLITKTVYYRLEEAQYKLNFYNSSGLQNQLILFHDVGVCIYQTHTQQFSSRLARGLRKREEEAEDKHKTSKGV